VIFISPPPLIAARLATIRNRSGTPAPAKPGLLYRVVVKPLPVRERMARVRRQMAALRARFLN
jgi:hypothetical protein